MQALREKSCILLEKSLQFAVASLTGERVAVSQSGINKRDGSTVFSFLSIKLKFCEDLILTQKVK